MNINIPSVQSTPTPTTTTRMLPAAANQTQVASIFDLDGARPELDVTSGLATVDECISLLVKTGLVFDRGGVLVAIDRDNSIHMMSASSIRFAVSKLAKFVKTTFAKGQLVTEPVIVPSFIGDTIASMTKWRGMPIVDAVADHPFLTSSNRLVKSGYDRETRVFGRFADTDFSVPDAPSMDDAAAALTDVSRLLQTLEFEAAGDESAALCAMLTAVSRPVLSTAPLVLIDAPMPGSGKGYLGGLIARLAADTCHAAKQLPDNHEEIHKAVVSALLAAKPVIFFDELAMSDVDCPAIRTLATAEIYGARLLGVMREVEVSTKVLALFTGNNIGATADTARRMLQLRLNPMVENPSSRHFSYSADRDMAENRNHFVSQLLTVQRAFLLAHQRGETTRPEAVMGGFRDWDLICRQPILWLTEVDPCTRMLETMRSNPAKTDLLAVMHAWQESFGNKHLSAGEVLKDAGFAEVASDSVNRRPGSLINSKALGHWLKRHKDQVVAGRRFVDAGIRDGYQLWSLETLK